MRTYGRLAGLEVTTLKKLTLVDRLTDMKTFEHIISGI